MRVFGAPLWFAIALMTAATAVSSPAPPASDSASDTMALRAAHGAITYDYLCAACHGGTGEGDPSRHIPPLAGERADALLQKLLALKADPAAAPTSAHAAALGQLDRDAIEGVALYLSALAAPPVTAG
jgi:cytochrome c553